MTYWREREIDALIEEEMGCSVVAKTIARENRENRKANLGEHDMRVALSDCINCRGRIKLTRGIIINLFPMIPYAANYDTSVFIFLNGWVNAPSEESKLNCKWAAFP